MKAIAIADHDLMAGVRAGAAAAAEAQMLFIPAMEITAHLHYGGEREEQFHVLAYYPHSVLQGVELEHKALYRRGLAVQERWKAFVLSWIDTRPLDEQAALGRDELEGLSPADFPALQSTILRIIDKKRELFEPFRDHHVRFWSSAGSNGDLFGWTPEEVIEAIRDDGAVDIVAHPARYRDKERTLAVLELAKGVEVYTSRHKAEVAAFYRDFAESRRKYWTSSSDDHQNARYIDPPCGTPARTLERICRRTFDLSALVA